MRESESIELKRGLAELKDGLISIAAILNKHGAGELWFGVRSDGIMVGLDVSEKTLRDPSDAIAAHTSEEIIQYATDKTTNKVTDEVLAILERE